MNNPIKRFLHRTARQISPTPKRFEHPWKVLCILIDNQKAADLLEYVLPRMGLEVTTVFDAQEGLELMRTEPPDVVILDEPTSGKDKYQVYNTIKADDALCQIPLVFAGLVPRGHWGPPGRDKGVVTWPCGPQELFEAIEWATGPERLDEQPFS